MLVSLVKQPQQRIYRYGKCNRYVGVFNIVDIKQFVTDIYKTFKCTVGNKYYIYDNSVIITVLEKGC